MIDRGRLEVAATLLFLQAGMGLVTVFGAVVVSLVVASAAMGAMTAAMLLGGGFWLLLGAGLLRGWRWSRRPTIALEWLAIAGGGIGVLLQVGTGLSLVALATNLVLPVVIIRLLATPKTASELTVR